MKKLRKVDTAKRKQDRKDAKKALETHAAMFLDHSKECCLCETEFIRSRKTVKTWHVTVHGERVRLTCPDCWGTINEVLENLDEA